jgi:hypothetical protein
MDIELRHLKRGILVGNRAVFGPVCVPGRDGLLDCPPSLLLILSGPLDEISEQLLDDP